MPTYTTEVIQSLPFYTTPVGQELIVGLSCDLCVAQELNVKFCFEIIIASNMSTPISLGVFKTTPNNAGVGRKDVSNILQNYVSADNIATGDSEFKIDGSLRRPIPIHLIDEFSRASSSVKALAVKGYTEFTDSSSVINLTDDVDVISLSAIINGYVKNTDLLNWVVNTPAGDAFGFSFNLEPYAIRDGSTRKLLSNSPSTQYARLEDYGTMSFLAVQNFSGMPLRVNVSYYQIDMFASDGSGLGTPIQVQRNVSNGAFSGTTNIGGDMSNRILYMGAFPANLRVNTAFNNQINDLAYYTIGLYNDADVLISEVKRVDILCPNLKGYTPIRLTWLNQFGTWDYYTFNQKSVKTLATKGTTYQQLSGSWNSNNYEPYGYKGGKKSFRVNASEKIKMNTDYLTEEHSEWFEELINSPEVYVLKDWELPRTISGIANINDTTNQYVTPVRLTTTSFTKKTVANDKLIQYTFEVEKSRNLRTQAI
jgi:hypothetical protein